MNTVRALLVLAAGIVLALAACQAAETPSATSVATTPPERTASPMPAATAAPAAELTPEPLPSDHPADALFRVGADGAPPCGIAGDGRTVWYADFRRSRIAIIDPVLDVVTARPNVNAGPCGMAYLDGALFVAERTSKMLYKRDAETLDALGDPVLGGGTIWDVDAGAGAVWFTDRGHEELVRVDPATNTAAARIDLGGEPSGLAVTDTAVWVAVESTNETLRIDPTSNEIVARIATGVQPIWIAATAELAWVTHADGSLVQVDTATNEITRQVALGGQPGEPAVAGDALWVPNQAGGTLTEIGLEDGTPRRTLTIGPGVAMVVNASGSLWVSGYTDGRLWRIGL